MMQFVLPDKYNKEKYRPFKETNECISVTLYYIQVCDFGDASIGWVSRR